MTKALEIPLDAPIAGQGLTAELGNVPWQNPPQYDTVEEALEFYIPRLLSEDFIGNLFDVMETGIPLTTIANSMQTAGVMGGKHSLDVGILIIPVLMETMAYLAEEADVEYTMGSNVTTDKDKPTQQRVALAMERVRKEESKKSKEPEPEPEVKEPEPEKPKAGLMSRRTTDGV